MFNKVLHWVQLFYMQYFTFLCLLLGMSGPERVKHTHALLPGLTESLALNLPIITMLLFGEVRRTVYCHRPDWRDWTSLSCMTNITVIIFQVNIQSMSLTNNVAFNTLNTFYNLFCSSRDYFLQPHKL